jgi:hypothetical protein
MTAMEDTAYEDSAMVESKAVENVHLLHDSMVTVRLSEPPSLTVVTQSMATREEDDSARDILLGTPDSNIESNEDLETNISSRHSMSIAAGDENTSSLPDLSDDLLTIDADERRESESTEDSGDGEVNWAELEKTEEQEPRDQDSEDVSRKISGFRFMANSKVHCFIARQT